MAHVREVGTLRAETLCHGYGRRHGGVSWMRTVAQGVEEEHVQIVQLRDGVVGKISMIRQIRHAPDSKAVHHCIAVNQWYRLKAQSQNFERTVIEDVRR